MWHIFRNIVKFLRGGRSGHDRDIAPPARQSARTFSSSAEPAPAEDIPAPILRKTHPRKKRFRRNRSKHPGEANRHGFRRLTDRDDLQALFLGTNGPSETTNRFEAMVEDNLPPVKLQEGVTAGQTSGTRPPPGLVAEQLRHYPDPEAELDLHGFTGPEAARRTEHFIRNAEGRGLRTLRIITGKGIHSENGPVLPDVVEQQVATLKAANIVLTFRWERKAKRQSGALLVYLR
jgi:hypothetical protein